MNIIKKYLEKKKEEKEKRKQQEFLNTKIPLNELVECEMLECFDKEYFGETLLTMGSTVKSKFYSYKILRTIKEKDGYSYIDPTTGRKYKKVSHYSVKIGDLVVGKDTIPLRFSKEALKRQYITIEDLIKFEMENKQNWIIQQNNQL